MMLGAGDSAARFNRIGHEMMCVCGCSQVLLECNHVGCPDSARMIGELHTQLTSGNTDTLILNWFAAKYGATVLAAPIRGGFDNIAWIAPIVVFLMATIGTAFLIRVWKLRSVQPIPASGELANDVGADAVRERIRKETQY